MSQQPLANPRPQIDRHLADGEFDHAWALLRHAWQTQPSAALAGFVVSRFAKLREHVTATPCSMVVLRSFTLEPVLPLVQAGAIVGGIDLKVTLGEFNAYAQEILDPNAAWQQQKPNVVVLAVQTRDIAPELWSDFADLSAEQADAVAVRVIGEFTTWIDTLRTRTDAHLIVHSLEQPPTLSQGELDRRIDHSQSRAIARINKALGQLAQDRHGVYLLDFDAVIAEHGRSHWYDAQKWLTVRLPMRAEALPAVAAAWLRLLHPITGRVAKCLVCDLDNTLWGGVVGEDGPTGIRLGVEYPGALYVQLQRAILDVSRRGILLAICSKNNPADAMEVLEKHEHMLLRPNDFAAMRINWQDKAGNLRQIAKELNIGIDALAFMDDNPAECQLVRQQLPQVTVIELPADPTTYSALLRSQPVFERLTMSQEDRRRGQMYAAQRSREAVRESAATLEDYYRSLQQVMEIALVNDASLERAAQMTQKTNQFNMTTRRYSEQQMAEFAADANCRVFTVRVTDRFGDNGIVGLAITRADGPMWELDTLLLSCRVIGRTVETAMLAAISDYARQHGATSLSGWFIPTAKNAPAKDVYTSHGFVEAERDGEAVRYELDLTTTDLKVPTWIDCRAALTETSS